MDVNENENYPTLHKLKLNNSAFIAVLHFTVTVGSSIMSHFVIKFAKTY
jgi:hypothetical protein